MASPIAYSCGKDKFDNCPEQLVAGDFEELVSFLESNRSQQKGKRYLCAAMTIGPHDDAEKYPGDNHWRLKNRVDKSRTLAKDFDGFRDLQAMGDVVNYLGKRFPCYFYTTANHTDDDPRGRLIIEANREMDREERIRVSEALEAELKEKFGDDAVKFDTSVYRAEQPCYAPLISAFTRTFKGKEAVDVDEYLARCNLSKAEKPPLSELSKALLSAPESSLPESAENIEVVRSALSFISPDIPYEGEEGNWRDIVWAVCSLGWGRRGKQLIKEWSEASERYTEEGLEKVLNSYSPDKTDAIGIGTLFYQAKKAGWVDPRTARIIAHPEQHITGHGGDITNGKLFAHIYKDQLVYVPELGSSLKFEPEAGWVKAPYGEVERAAKAVVKMMRERAAELYTNDPEGHKTKGLMKHVEASSKMPKLRDLIDAAKSEPGMSRSLNEFDADRMLLGLSNGVFDLRTQRLLPITPDILVTKRCKVAYDRNAKCLRFDQFMVEIQPDPVIRDFLQRLAGYLLTGQVSEQIFVFMYGLGANGKSVFIELLAWLMGDYGRKIATEMLMHHQRSPQGPSPDIVALKGIRLAYANETEEGRRLAEARVKDMTGGDTLTGRVPYAKANITFPPTHKLLIVGNHKPEITDSSFGMWRRVVLIDFGVTIPENQQDKHLLNKLKSEGPGILNWMLEGARQWKLGGLQVPQTVQAVTQAYRDEQDIIGEWIADHCKTGAGCTEDKKALYGAYRGWMVSNGHYPLAQGRLTRRLNDRGYQLQPDKRTVAGLELKPSIRGHVS